MLRSKMILVIGLAYVTTYCCVYTLVTKIEYKYGNGKKIRGVENAGNASWKDRDVRSKREVEYIEHENGKSNDHPMFSLNNTRSESTVLRQYNFSRQLVDHTIGGNGSKSNGEMLLNNKNLNSTLAKCLEAEEPDCSHFVKNESRSKIIDELCYSPSDSLTCYQDPIFCEAFHLSGKRELKWPAYGEYSYLPHEHWVKVLQHGGVVFLYHPCAENSSVHMLRNLAGSCMHRYVLTKYHKLTPERPLALVSWGCFLLMGNVVNFTKSQLWIKLHAYKGPASHIHENGTYEHKLVRPAKVLTDVKDTLLCPSEKEKASLHLTKTPQPIAKRRKLTVNHKQVVEEILLKRLQKAKHNIITHPFQQNKVPVDTKKSLAAFGSLVFLSILLLVLLLYTKLWRPRIPSRSAYVKLGDLDAESEEQYYESNFSLLKTGQDFISSLKRSRRDRKQGSYSRVRLLAPISEDDHEMDKS